MPPSEFTERAEVYHIVNDVREACKGKTFSDIVDDDGHEYVDLVMEGGGVLGIALVGYTYLLEEMGIRFLGIGGTSAGSINALLVAALGPPAARKSEKMVHLLEDLDLYSFVDGGSHVRRFLHSMANESGWLRRVLPALRIWRPLNENLGLNPGEAFSEWLEEIMAAEGIHTVEDLQELMGTVPTGLRRRNGAAIGREEAAANLALVAADISTETKVEFPRMAGLYWKDPMQVNPAKFVRASMSIPIFFHPLRLEGMPLGRNALDRWRKLASYTEDVPEECLLVDGGIMSNFPIDIFHVPLTIPPAPTFGAKLGSNRRQRRSIRSPTEFTRAVFNSARHCLDYDFVTKNPDYRHLVTCIDTGDHDWLNFQMSKEDKMDLFTCGVRAAAQFLIRFDWDRYKRIRADMRVAFVDSLMSPGTSHADSEG